MNTPPDPGDIKLIAFDLDGTLFGADQQISSRTASTLALVAEHDVDLVIASGRSQTSIIPRVGNVPFIRWAVCSNGATLFDLIDNKPMQVWPIDESHLVDLIAAIEGALPDIVWAWEEVSGHHWTEAFVSSGLHDAIRGTMRSDDARPSADALKVLVGHEEVRRYDLLDAIAPLVPHGLGVSTSGADFVEVVATGINKGAGLADLCHRLDIAPQHVVAFGDNVNDVEMMEWVGHSFAMANAHPRLSAVASHRTARPHDVDGVADTLETIFRLS